MKLIFAFGGSWKNTGRLFTECNVKNVLLSYTRVDELCSTPEQKAWWKARNLFFDSGGFTAQMKGVHIDVTRYGEYVKKNIDLFEYYANLDPTSPEETYQNYKVLLSMGLSPLPIYRSFDYFDSRYRKLIDEYCETRDYICIGGVASQPGHLSSGEYDFYDYVFRRAVKHNTKVHALGIADSDYLTRYPFYSFDTTKWQLGERFGTYVRFNSKRGCLETYSSIRGRHSRGIGGIKRDGIMVLQDPMTKNRLAIEALLQYEDYLTRLWAKRGMVWGEGGSAL